MITFEDAKKVLAALDREKVRYVLIGSMGMAALGVIRATRDIDLFVHPSPDNVARLKKALKSVFADPHIDEISAEDLGGDYPAIQYVPPDGTFSLDLLSRLGDAFTYDQIEYEEILVDGIRVCVATARMLYRMKRDTVRPQDRLDAAELKRRFGLAEEE
jgi:predicted nucleotidyltransferase